jgi:hypothetical protein
MTRIYNYLCHACQPLGIGNDDDGDPTYLPGVQFRHDSDGIGRILDSERPEGVLAGTVRLPHGTMMRRAFDKLRAAGIEHVLAHTIPPHPDSELGQLMKQLCYADVPTAIGKLHAIWRDCGNFALNQGEEQIFECDGSYEEAIRDCTRVACDCCACKDMNFVTSAPINAICTYLNAIDPQYNSMAYHPILNHVRDLYPKYITDGRSMDIWNPAIVDVLEYFYRAQFGVGRRISGLWLTLGGPFLWGETCHMATGSKYYINTPSAAKALCRTEEYIDMNREGLQYAPLIAARVGRIAEDLVKRLADLTSDFYFHVYTIPKTSEKAGWMAAGMVGVARTLCERLSKIPYINAHMICSHGHEASPECAAEALDLIRTYPNIEFISGVGWGNKLHTNGLARLVEGWPAIEVGLQDAGQWSKLKLQVQYIRDMLEHTL